MSTPLAKGGTFNFGSLTQAADTKIKRLIPPKAGFRTLLQKLRYISAGTAHTLTVLRPLGSTTLTAAVAAGASYVLPVAADPGSVAIMKLYSPSGTATLLGANAVAANDHLVIQLPDGTFFLDTVASVSSLNVTMNGTLPTGGAAIGARVWHLGVEADVEPWSALAHGAFKPTVSAVTEYFNEDGIFCTGGKNQPLLIISSNATAAGTIDAAAGIYAP